MPLHQNNVNIQKENRKTSFAPMFDTVSFSAKIPQNLKTLQEYNFIFEHFEDQFENRFENQPMNVYQYYQKEKVLKLLKEIQKDPEASAEIGRKIFNAEANGQSIFHKKMSDLKNISPMFSDKKDLELEIIKEMFALSPSDKATKKMLLEADSEGKTLMHYAFEDKETAKKAIDMLLEVSPNSDTKFEQMFKPMKKGEKTEVYNSSPFAMAELNDRYDMIKALDARTQKKEFTNPELISDILRMHSGEEVIKTLCGLGTPIGVKLNLDVVNSINLQTGDNILHLLEEPSQLDYIVKLNEYYPENIKRMLLEKNNEGEIPIVTTPFRSMLKPFLDKSTNEEILMEQIKARRTFSKIFNSNTLVTYEAPVIAGLEIDEIAEILSIGLLDNQKRKELLLKTDWEKNTLINNSSRTDANFALAEHLNDCINSKSAYFEEILKEDMPDRKEVSEARSAITKVIQEVIEDDSTTEAEAYKICRMYKDVVSPYEKDYFEKLQNYFYQRITDKD